MKVYVLVGKSGTGKSFQAISLCKEKNIEAIIDDGLFIYNGEVKAGTSAKREGTIIGAIKTALFTKEEHRRSVSRKLWKQNPKKILVIGTSDGMVEKIVERLKLPEIKERIYIDDITTEGEREIARKQRNVHGKHVVPVPAMQLKRQFSGYFVNPLRIFKGWGIEKGDVSEKSEVRPTYSYLGEFTISDKALVDIVKCVSTDIEGVLSVLRVDALETRTGMKLVVLVSFDMEYGALETARNLQKQVYIMTEGMTAFNIEDVRIEIRTVG